MTLHLAQGDITLRDDDAIVNAANERLLPGGGVCGAIHRAAGPELENACRAIGHCPTGSAVITPGFGLKARHVIHAVGPRWEGGSKGEAKLLNECYKNIFRIAMKNNLKTLSIPAISTGIFGYPIGKATEIALSVAREFDREHPAIDVTFICFDALTYEVYKRSPVFKV